MWLSHIPKLSVSGLFGDLSEPKPWWSVANQIARLDKAIHSLCLTASQMVSLSVSQETAGEKFRAEFCMRKTQNTESLFLAKLYGSYFKSWVILGIFIFSDITLIICYLTPSIKWILRYAFFSVCLPYLTNYVIRPLLFHNVIITFITRWIY